MKTVEYAVTRNNGEDVDHVSWREARRMVANLNSFNPQYPDVTLIERVTRYWQEDGELTRQEDETLWRKGGIANANND